MGYDSRGVRSESMACPQETELSAFIARTLPAGAAARLEAHLADCDDCRRLVFALASSSFADEADTGPAVEQVGRFELIDVIGRGAMGVVYRARDPELDRVVAIKLRRGPSRLEVDGEDRLRREAQALARLAHPNVVAIYEAGRHERTTYLAMEYVEGAPLDGWLATRPPLGVVIARMIEAGRGLAAAHGVGLVHRDFKPRNVFVSTAGSAKVGDFGLVRVDGADPAEATGGVTPALAHTLTMSGAMLGTPAYMAPEQLCGETATEASDQFSFCVTLFEAIYGRRPFAGVTIEQLLAEMRKPLVLPAPPRVPARVGRVLVRGLDVDPAGRFPSMTALLEVLDPRTTKRRRGALVGAVAAGVVAIGGVTFAALAPEPREVCRGAERNLAGVWDPARKAQIRAAFTATGVAYAADAWRGVERILDGYQREWVTMHRGACEATRVHGEQSEQVLSLRMWCLDDRLRDARALTDAFATADRSVVARAVDAAARLARVDVCADARALSEKQPPRDAAAKLRIEGLQADLATARAKADLGQFEDSVAGLGKVTEAAKREAYAPLQAEALVELARVQFMRTGDAKQAEQAMTEAVLVAERGRHDVVRARALIVLVYLVGIVQARTAEGHELVAHASAVIERLVGGEAIEGQLLGNEGQLLAVEGKFAEAEERMARGLALLERTIGTDHVETGRVLAQLSDLARRRGDLDKAVALAERASAIHERGYGPAHPETAKSLFGVGIALEDQGKYDAAAERVLRTLAILEAALGKDHLDLAVATDELGIIRRKQEKLAEAEALHRRALALRETGLGPDHPETAISLDNLGLVIGLQERHAEALALHERSLAITEKALGADHPETAASHGYLANCYLGMNRDKDALAEFQLALERTEKALGPDHFDLAFYLSGIGHAHLGLHQPKAAIGPLERAIRVRHGEGDPMSSAEIDFALARALWDTKQDRARALRLAEGARAPYQQAGKRDVEDWLATHHRRAR